MLLELVSRLFSEITTEDRLQLKDGVFPWGSFTVFVRHSPELLKALNLEGQATFARNKALTRLKARYKRAILQYFAKMPYEGSVEGARKALTSGAETSAVADVSTAVDVWKPPDTRTKFATKKGRRGMQYLSTKYTKVRQFQRKRAVGGGR